MSGSEQDELAGLVDVQRLDDWLGDQVEGQGQPLNARRVSEGASNEIIFLERGGHRWVLRRPPEGHYDPDFANWIVMREARVCRALDGTPVPHPTVRAACDDPDVIGANFYVMDLIDGFTPQDPLPEPFTSSPDARSQMGRELIDALAELANVDWKAQGLEGFGKPDGFLDRQVERWLRQLSTYQNRELPHLDTVGDWLERNQPEMQRSAIMHGDYQFINTMFHHGRPARMAAIIDWEQSTVGDPLLDLGWLLFGWTGGPDEPDQDSGYFKQRSGLPTKAEMIARYEERTGLDASALPYYEVLARFKLACVLEGSYQRFVEGRSDNPKHEVMGQIVIDLLEQAEEQVRTTG